MHKIAHLYYLVQTNIQNVLISHYRMYGRLGNVEMRGAGPHRRICLYYVLRFFYHTLRYIIPHDKLPNLDIINLFLCMSNYAVYCK